MIRTIFWMEVSTSVAIVILAAAWVLDGASVEPWIALLGALMLPLEISRHRAVRIQLDASALRGKIQRPRRGDVVSRTIDCRGWVRGIPTGVHFWLMVELDNSKWPKEGAVQLDPEGNWRHRIFEDGNPDSFAIGLYAASDEGHNRIVGWLDAGRKNDSYPPFTWFTGIRRVARVDGLRMEPPNLAGPALAKRALHPTPPAVRERGGGRP